MGKSIRSDLIEIIKTCADCGVLEFRDGELEIKFSGWVTTQAPKPPVQSNAGGGEPSTASENVEPAVPDELTDEQLDELMLTNPVAYEDALIKAKDNQ